MVKYFTAKEVATHNKIHDIWVSVFGSVYDLTLLVNQYCKLEPQLIKPLLMFAGKDVSHWFDRESKEFLHYTDVNTNERKLFAPYGLILHVMSSSHDQLQWWNNKNLEVGRLTSRTRHVRVINTLTGGSTRLETCSEDTCARVRERYRNLGYSDEAYTWISANNFLEIDMLKTLDENNLVDESDRFAAIGLPTDLHIPAVLLVYNGLITPSLVYF